MDLWVAFLFQLPDSSTKTQWICEKLIVTRQKSSTWWTTWLPWGIFLFKYSFLKQFLHFIKALFWLMANENCLHNPAFDACIVAVNFSYRSYFFKKRIKKIITHIVIAKSNNRFGHFIRRRPGIKTSVI